VAEGVSARRLENIKLYQKLTFSYLALPTDVPTVMGRRMKATSVACGRAEPPSAHYQVERGGKKPSENVGVNVQRKRPTHNGLLERAGSIGQIADSGDETCHFALLPDE
jgi:hypothetical protein